MSPAPKTCEVSLVWQEVKALPSLPALLKSLTGCPHPFVLGDFSPQSPGCYSYLGAAPTQVCTFRAGDGDDPFDLLHRCCQTYRLGDDASVPAPFIGGWVGAFSYDLSRYIERLPDEVDHDLPLPLMHLAFYDSLIAWNHDKKQGYLIALEYAAQKTSPAKRLDNLRRLLGAAAQTDAQPLPVAPRPDRTSTDDLLDELTANITPAEYLHKIEVAKKHIHAGDIYEVNLSRRFSMPYDRGPEDLYATLARHNPAAYSALIVADDFSLVSASPELFLQKRGLQILTRPIKGTIARGADDDEDRQNRLQLQQSAKDQAELNMIIDLERNDLNRICQPGSVQVRTERTIEAHPTLFHAVADIAGTLRADTTVADIFRATFPGGSVTGAPKIRAMEIIDQLEPTARNFYTGAIGWFGVNGDLDLNIAIRTIVLSQCRAYLQTGGAIVDDSTCQGEYRETLAKARALAAALQQTAQKPPNAICT